MQSNRVLVTLVALGLSLAVSLPANGAPPTKTTAGVRTLETTLSAHRHGPLSGRNLSTVPAQPRPKTARKTARKATGKKLSARDSGTANSPFLSAPQFSTGGSPVAAVAGDFNGDTNKDVAAIVSNAGSYSLAVQLGNGDGSFQAPVLTSITFDTSDRLLAADANRDGNDDLLIVRTSSLDVFLGNGDGTFAPAVNYLDVIDGALIPGAVVVTDVDGDGKVDVIIADGTNSIVSTVTGNGDGTFRATSQTWLTGQFSNGVFADVNGDGTLDVVGSSNVFTYNQNDGGFETSASLVLANGASNSCGDQDGVVAVADVNNDTHLDIVTAGCDANTVNVFLGNGDGTFQLGTSQWAGFDPVAVTLADVNHDGSIDILSSNAFSSDITVLLGNGDGTFLSPTVGYAMGGAFAAKPLVATFDGDTYPDVIAPQFVPGAEAGVTVLRGLGDGTFAAALDYFQSGSDSDSYGVAVAFADFNGDGVPDFVEGNSAAGTDPGVTVFLGNSDGTVQPGANYGTGGHLSFVATGDFNQDNKQDIVADDTNTGEVELFLGNGDGTFQTALNFAGAQGPSVAIAVGDFDKDGRQDVAVVGASANVFVLLNSVTGFQSPVAYTLSGAGWKIASADLNGDGNLDLVVTQSTSSVASVLMGVGDGTFVSASDVNLGHNTADGLAVHDLNGDGHPDLAVAIDDSTSMGIAVALGNGDGTFQAATLYAASSQPAAATASFPSDISVTDLNRDGKFDLIYANMGFSTVGILYGNGDGTFATPVEVPAGSYNYGMVLADINGDGALDVVTADAEFPGITVLLNQAASTTTLASSENPAAYGQPVVLTATVAASPRGSSGLPTGTVTFFDGVDSIGSASVNGSGHAMLSVPAFTAGDHSLTATYSGDAFFPPSASSVLTQTIEPAGADYSLAADPPTASLEAGQSAVFTITATPQNGFTGTVDFSCGTLPDGVTCEFSPESVSLSNGQPASVQLTLNTSSTVSSASPVPPNSNRGLPLWLSLWPSMSGGIFGWVLMEGRDPRKRRRLTVAALAVVLFTVLVLTGCGTGSPNSSTVASSAHKIVHVIATTHGNDQGSHQLNLNIIIL